MKAYRAKKAVKAAYLPCGCFRGVKNGKLVKVTNSPINSVTPHWCKKGSFLKIIQEGDFSSNLQNLLNKLGYEKH
jgi:hypothetical protein